MNILNTDIKFVKGVGDRRAEILQKEIDVFTLGDLLRWYPYRYIDRSRLYYVCELEGSMPYVQIKGTIRSIEMMGEGRTQRLVAHFSDDTGFVDLVWFQSAKYMQDKLKMNQTYIVFGKPTMFNNRWNIAHPEMDAYLSPADRPEGLMPLYNTTEKMKKHGLNSKAMQKIIENAYAMIKEPLAATLS